MSSRRRGGQYLGYKPAADVITLIQTGLPSFQLAMRDVYGIICVLLLCCVGVHGNVRRALAGFLPP